ncbi:hypothetical protein ACHMW7_08100 [Aminobacter sp. UC22_36]|uniref:hypothetical protein n=1 Tax=Aminobacter sp. UC22_36 TaxID=3374549 RepID=UPI003756CC71
MAMDLYVINFEPRSKASSVGKVNSFLADFVLIGQLTENIDLSWICRANAPLLARCVAGNKSVIEKLFDLTVTGNTTLRIRRDAGPKEDLKC